MEYGKIDEPHFVVCLEGGDEIHDSLVAFVEKEHITFGMIQGIGTVREVTLGCTFPSSSGRKSASSPSSSTSRKA